MTWSNFLLFLGHGGIKLLIILFFFVVKILKASAKKAAKERPPLAKFPNEMPSQSQTITPSRSRNNNATTQRDLGSPWSSSGDPFEGGKK